MNNGRNQKYLEYRDNNKTIFEDRVVHEFFNIDYNVDLLLRTLGGDTESKDELEKRFRNHFFRIRFIKYLVSTIKFSTVDQFRNNHKNDVRNPLIFDLPTTSDQGSSSTIGELLCSQLPQSEENPIFDLPSFEESLTNLELETAFSNLSPNQKLVSSLVYGMSYKDIEVSKIMGVTPQAVNKTRKTALSKLRSHLIREEVI